MPEYSKTTWVENVTKVGPTRMNALEQGVADATDQALLTPGAGGLALTGKGGTEDKERVVWTRTAGGAMVATMHTYESGSGATLVSTQHDRVTVSNTNGMTAERRIEAASRGGAPIVTGIARLLLQAIRGGRYKVAAEVTAETSADPTFSATILDDTGASDFVFRTAWTNVTPASPWTLDSPAAAYKVSDSMVWIGGRLKNTVAGYTYPSALFTLPAGARPAATIRLIAQAEDASDSSKDAVLISISAAGVVSLDANIPGSSQSGAQNSVVNLDALHFRL